MSSQAEQLAEQMPPYTIAHRFATQTPALIQERFDPFEEKRRFFFMVTGEGGTWRRCAMIFALSSMIHSMTSPFSNSMASATAVGKLM
jgi:hypothetical protein